MRKVVIWQDPKIIAPETKIAPEQELSALKVI